MTAYLDVTPESTDLATPQNELDKNPAYLYLTGLAPGSRRTMIVALGTMAAILAGDLDEENAVDVHGKSELLAAAINYPWHELTKPLTTALRADLATRFSAATANKMLSALRRVLLEAWDLELMTEEQRARASRLPAVKGETVPAGRDIKFGELVALMEACEADPTAAGARDAAMLALLYSCGLRRAEIAAIQMADVDTEAGTILIHGKRNKDRIAHTVNSSADALADWLMIRGTDDGPLFVPVNKGGAMALGTPIIPQNVYAMLQKRAGEAGVSDLTPHDFRRTFVGDLLDAGADIATVQRLAGHANVTTTARYDRRPEAAKRKAAGLLHIPYRRRDRA